MLRATPSSQAPPVSSSLAASRCPQRWRRKSRRRFVRTCCIRSSSTRRHRLGTTRPLCVDGVPTGLSRPSGSAWATRSRRTPTSSRSRCSHDLRSRLSSRSASTTPSHYSCTIDHGEWWRTGLLARRLSDRRGVWWDLPAHRCRSRSADLRPGDGIERWLPSDDQNYAAAVTSGGPTTDLISGANRYELALNVSSRAFPTTAPVVYIAPAPTTPMLYLPRRSPPTPTGPCCWH